MCKRELLPLFHSFVRSFPFPEFFPAAICLKWSPLSLPPSLASIKSLRAECARRRRTIEVQQSCLYDGKTPADFQKVCTRAVLIPLFSGSGLGIRIATRLIILLWIQIRGWNHNTSIDVMNPLFPMIRIRNRNCHKSQKELKCDSEPNPGPES